MNIAEGSVQYEIITLTYQWCGATDKTKYVMYDV